MEINIAAARGDLDFFITNWESIDLNSEDEDGASPPMCAIAKCRVELVQYILTRSSNLDVNKQNKVNGDTLLMFSCELGHVKIVKSLLNHSRINVNLKDHVGHNALSLAIHNGHKEVVYLLLEREDLETEPRNIKGRLQKNNYLFVTNVMGLIFALLRKCF